VPRREKKGGIVLCENVTKDVKGVEGVARNGAVLRDGPRPDSAQGSYCVFRQAGFQEEAAGYLISLGAPLAIQ